MSNSQNEFSRAQMEVLAEAVASKVVEEMLIKLGIDHSRPLEVQHDFLALRDVRTLLTDREFQADLSYLRKWRQAMESGTSKSVLAILALLVSGAAAIFVVGFKAWVHPGQ